MNPTSSLLIVAVAGLIHSSFQLSVSMLTLLSSHAIGRRRSQRHLIVLTNSFVAGVAVMTLLLLSFLALVLGQLLSHTNDLVFVWTICCGLLAGLGLSVWLFYYRREAGTTLWIPRALARYLTDRTKATKQGAEAFGLGLASAIGELLFIFAPLVVSALVLLQLEPTWQLAGLCIYAVTSLLSLLIVNVLIGSGHSISRVQKWRERNKSFLQFVAGSGLIVLGFYLYVDKVLSSALAGTAGVMR